jgi:hypothetical protein
LAQADAATLGAMPVSETNGSARVH